MKTLVALVLFFSVGTFSLTGFASDWPQWRGPNRDAKATGFKVPSTWPSELKQQWKVEVGDGVATPALVGDKLFVFTRQGGTEIIRCLEASNGKEIWQDKYEAKAIQGPAQSFPGPRSSPSVADGKVVTLGVSCILSCYDAASGKLLWRQDEFKNNVPSFFVSSSPMIVDDLCIAQMGGGDTQRSDGKGAIVAYDLNSGKEKWKWEGDGTAYASPVLQNVDGAKEVVAETAKNVVGISVADGKLQWQIAFPLDGQMRYNAATPIVEGATVIYTGTGRGTKAVKIEKNGEKLGTKELWSNKDISVQFNSPLVKNGLIFGLTERDALFCLNAQDGKTAWTQSFQQTQSQPPAAVPPAKGAPGKGLGGRGMRGRPGYGSIVDAGSVLVALTPNGQLVVFEPNDKEFKQIAKYKVGAGDTYAYPVLDGNRIFVKDKDSVILLMVD
jgi:outer membrane protein assembly factor BamB